MKSKVSELGVFLIGIGGLIALGAVYLWKTLEVPGGPSREFPYVPVGISAALIILGVLVLVLRSQLLVNLSVGILILGLIVDALLSPHPLKILISFGVCLLVLKTGARARQEIQGEVNRESQQGGTQAASDV